MIDHYLESLVDSIRRDIEKEEKEIQDYVIRVRINLILCKVLLALVLAIKEKK